MAKLSIVFGVVLIGIGIFGYVSTGSAYPTALIPAAFGLLLAIFGALAMNPQRRKLFMHINVTLGLLGFLGTAKAIYDLVKMERGTVYPYPAAVEAKAAMSIVCLVFVVLCVRSFVAARRMSA